MNDQLRRELWEHPQEFIGRVVELVHWGIQDSGALRFPQVRRLRSADKPSPAGPRQTEARAGTLTAKPPSAAAELVRPAKPWMRNYGAMRGPKLLDSIESLRERSGEAFQKCIEADGDVAEHLAAAERAARKKNLL
jgi:hypothetical protein